MKTLDELKTMQDVYDYVVEALWIQGRKSTNRQVCLYRGHENSKCAIGHLISDDNYNKNMEGLGVGDLKKDILPRNIQHLSIIFFEELQIAHDYCRAEDFKESLIHYMRLMAIRWDLSYEIFYRLKQQYPVNKS